MSIRTGWIRTGLVPVIAGLVAVSASADAQGRGRGQSKVPPGHLPSAGECRVWYDGRPPGQQPAPTDCRRAEYEASRSGGRVIYGSDRRDDRRDRKDDRRDERRDRRDDDRRDDDRDDDDRDERRDDRRADRRDGACVDRDRDGRCDAVYDDDDDRRYPTSSDAERYPSTLPEMVLGSVFGGGNRNRIAEARRWVGAGDVRPRYTDADRNGRPETVSWYDPRGVLLQQWNDENRDGRADRVSLYRNGRVVRVIR